MIISINSRTGPYKPGSVVSGLVEFPVDRDYDVEILMVSFTGRLKTKITESSGNNSKTRHRGRVQLFRVDQTLFKGPYTMHGKQKFPFHFSFPHTCNTYPRYPLSDYFQPSQLFNDNKDQPLPASFQYYSTAGFTRPEVDAYISYELEAKLFTGKTFGGDATATQRLMLTRDRLVEVPDPSLTTRTHKFSMRSKYLLPEFRDRRPSLKEKLSVSFHSWEMPVTVFNIGLVMPKVVVEGQRMPLFLNLEHDIESSTAPAPPIIYLRKIKWEIQARTYVRCVSASMFHSSDAMELSEDDFRIADCAFSEHSVPLSEHMNLVELLAGHDCSMRPATTLAPSFKSFNISRSYRMNVKLSIECARQKLSYTFSEPEVVLLSRDYSPPAPVVCQKEDAAEDSVADGEALPTYQEAFKS
ncbi:MAG: hypothetical protein LQ342_006969 [Letrouitia transgressa]|nr:MAG: hypothetical protein LQ342_006969 [Letrouitia transgressa]